jgi:hypothetical protein
VFIMAVAVFYDRFARRFGPVASAPGALVALFERVSKKLDKWHASQQIQFNKEQHATDTQQEKEGAATVSDRLQGGVPGAVLAAARVDQVHLRSSEGSWLHPGD